MIGVAACNFNVLGCAVRPCSVVDNGRWTAVWVVALQIWDFGSDILLTVEVWRRDDVWRRPLMRGVAVASSFFVVLPYCANLFAAARVKSLSHGVIERNEAAATWLE